MSIMDHLGRVYDDAIGHSQERSFHYSVAGLVAWAKANPLRIDSFVAVYEDSSQSMLICYGQIKAMKWDDTSDAYIYEIEVAQNGNRIDAFSFHCRPVDASEIRLLFTVLRHPCDL